MDLCIAVVHNPATKLRSKKKAARRWHRREFSGCRTCRSRHVKCDEHKPCCKRCSSLGIDCGGYSQNLVFKFYENRPTSTSVTSCDLTQTTSTPKDFVKSNLQPLGSMSSPAASTSSHVIQTSDPNLSPRQLAVTPPLFQQLLVCPGEAYTTHFLNTVSSILIVWDAPYNSNPYRLSLPYLAQSSWSLMESMKALGALHLANTATGQERTHHLKYAMKTYGQILFGLQKSSNYSYPRLSDLATSLLLCLFEVSTLMSIYKFKDANKV
jgi:hypothetical protein